MVTRVGYIWVPPAWKRHDFGFVLAKEEYKSGESSYWVGITNDQIVCLNLIPASRNSGRFWISFPTTDSTQEK